MRGPLLHQYGSSDIALPSNFSKALLWSFQNPSGQYASVVAGGPVIDSDRNIYLSMNDGIRKLSPRGDVLWYYGQMDRKFNNQAALSGDKLLSSNENGIAFALDTETGVPIWSMKVAENAGQECGYPAAFGGVFVVGGQMSTVPGHIGGNSQIFGLDVNTGYILWEFLPTMPVWNFEPLFPGDDTVVFMDFTGSLYRLGLHDGRLVWYNPVEGASSSFSDGGAALGPNGAVYGCSNPADQGGSEGGQGLLRAVSLEDGSLLWQQILPQPCNSYPAVGQLGKGQGLSVAVTPGSFMGARNLHGSIMAFDAESGQPRWLANFKPYQGYEARGDIIGMPGRLMSGNLEHLRCLPAHWSSANIARDGTVVAARSDGFIYAVRGPPAPTNASALTSLAELPADFATSPGVDTMMWDAGGASLHGAFAFAPGLVAVATCDTLYVFKS